MPDKQKVILCPYCGNTQTEPEDRCTSCGGFFDSLSLKVTQQAMGPWFVRDRHVPFRPGCTYEVLRSQIEKGKIKPTTILRGPTTRQFWSVARNVPGVAHLLGYCHACGSHVDANADACGECGEVFFVPKLRDQLGLSPLDPSVHAEAARSRQQSPVDAPVAVEPDDDADKAVAEEEAQSTGSGILANLRLPEPVDDLALGEPDSLPAAQPAPPQQEQAVTLPDQQKITRAPGQNEPDAMQWMTAGADEEPDDLETAGQAVGGIRKKSGGLNLTTWLLIGMNGLLLLAVVLVIVLIVAQPHSPTKPHRPEPAPASDPAPADFDETMDAAESTDAATAPETTVATAAPTPDVPIPQAPSVGNPWQEMYERATGAQRLGELEQAKALLDRIHYQAPDSMRPEGLDKAIAQVTRQLNERQVAQFLKVYVPPPGELASGSSPQPVQPAAGPSPRSHGLFSAEAPANNHERIKANRKQRFGEALALEIDGEYHKALQIMQEIAASPKDQHPNGFNDAYNRIRKKAEKR